MKESLSKRFLASVPIFTLLLSGQMMTAGQADGAGPTRGTWLFDKVGTDVSDHEKLNQFASSTIVGNVAKEDWAISFMQQWDIQRVYLAVAPANLGQEPGKVSDSDLRNWNRKLHEAGIESHVLLSEKVWSFNGAPPTSDDPTFPQFPDTNDPAVSGLTSPRDLRQDLTGLTGQIQTKLLNFNVNTADEAEKYDGLRLDLEPWALRYMERAGEFGVTFEGWDFNQEDDQNDPVKDQRPQIRRDYLTLLRDTFNDARSLFESAHVSGPGGAPLHFSADLATFFDLLNDNPFSSVGWVGDSDQGKADRDAWFDSLAKDGASGQVLDGLTLLPFRTPDVAVITNNLGDGSVDWEVDQLADELDLRIGLEALIQGMPIMDDASQLAPAAAAAQDEEAWESAQAFIDAIESIETLLDGRISGVDIQSFAMFAAAIPEPGSAIVLLGGISVLPRRRNERCTPRV